MNCGKRGVLTRTGGKIGNTGNLSPGDGFPSFFIGLFMAIKKITTSTGKPRYKATIYVGVDKNGKEIKIYKTKKTKREASDWVHEQQGLLKDAKHLKQFSEIADLVSEYLADIRVRAKANTFKQYERYFDKWITPKFNDLRLIDLNESIVEDFARKVIDQDVSEKNVNYIINRLDSFLEWCVQKGYCEKNHAKQIPRVKVEITDSTVIKYHNEQSIKKMMEYIKGKQYEDIIVFLYNTGLRISEVAALRVSDVDLETNEIHIKHSISQFVSKSNKTQNEIGTLYMGSTKGNMDRKIMVNDICANMLKRLCSKKKENDFVFTTSKGRDRKIIERKNGKTNIFYAKVINSNEFTNDVFKPYQIRAGLSSLQIIGVHGARHTFAVNYLKNGGSLLALSKHLGHKSIKTTQIYTHISNDEMKKNRNLVKIGIS